MRVDVAFGPKEQVSALRVVLRAAAREGARCTRKYHTREAGRLIAFCSEHVCAHTNDHNHVHIADWSASSGRHPPINTQSVGEPANEPILSSLH